MFFGEAEGSRGGVLIGVLIFADLPTQGLLYIGQLTRLRIVLGFHPHLQPYVYLPSILPHHRRWNKLIKLARKLDADNYVKDEKYQSIRKVRGYSYEDKITVHPSTLPEYEKKLKIFFEEHIHTDEEIRFCLEGSGYFDVRDLEDNWIRIKMDKNDMIVLPAGIYHRFTLDDKNYIQALRLFVGEPVWTPLNRPQDNHEVRKEYLHSIQVA